MEGTKYLVGDDSAAVLGLSSFPHLRTLRPRLKALAEVINPLALQRCFATAILDTDIAPPQVFYVDDHFVTYWGDKPVARATTSPAISPSRGETTLPGILDDLAAVTGGRRIMVGFDWGGSYPAVFTAIAAAKMEWVTWRRAPLVPSAGPPRRDTVEIHGRKREYLVADETVILSGYDAGPVRQLSAYEGDTVVFRSSPRT